jgi:hypothetical protein
MMAMVPPGMIIPVVTRPVVIAIAVIGITVVVTPRIGGIVISRWSEEKPEADTCLGGLWSESRQTKSSEPNYKVFFHTVIPFGDARLAKFP